MRYRPVGVSIYSIVWHQGITQLKTQDVGASGNFFTGSDVLNQKKEQGGFLVFHSDHCLLITTVTYHGWEGLLGATIPGYLFYYTVRRLCLFRALGAGRNIVIRLHDDIGNNY